MRVLARVLAIGSFAGLGGIAYTVYSPAPLTQPSGSSVEAAPEPLPTELVGTDPQATQIAAAAIRITPEDITGPPSSTLDTQQLLDALPAAERSHDTRLRASYPTPTSTASTNGTRSSKSAVKTGAGVSTADLLRLNQAVTRSAGIGRSNRPVGFSPFAFAAGTGSPSFGNSTPRANTAMTPTNTARGTSGGGGGGSSMFGGSGSNSPSLAEQGGILQAITAQTPTSSPTSTLLADNSLAGTADTKDYSKFGIQNAQFWAFDFSAGENENGDVNGDNIIDVADARFQFDAYLDYLQQELDEPEHLQVVRNSVDDLSRIFDEFNTEAAQKQDPDPTDAISENFVSYMIIEFDTKGFYLPNNDKFRDQATNSNAWQFSANSDPGLNP